MWSIHPEQVQPIVQAFTPSASELDEACEILIAAQAAQWGPIEYHNRLHDRASYRYFWSILQRAQKTGMVLSEAALTLLSPVEK
jgi:citrate lyase subunit beta/citryl-CoA lyase